MKKIYLIFIALLFTSINFGQVIIAPYIVYTDEHNKYGSMIVQNESFDSYEISISFVFGYPISDTLGNRSMQYHQEETDSMPSINNWIKAFPKKFVLKPKEKQTIRLMVKPPKDIDDGTYWTRIVTSSSMVDTSVSDGVKGVAAKLKFVLNQVTTAIYRKGDISTGINFDNLRLYKDSTNTNQILIDLIKEGNSPYFGYVNLKYYDTADNLIQEERDYIGLYYNMVKNYVLPNDVFKNGDYKVVIDSEFNEKEDIPESRLENIQNISKSFKFSIP